MRAIEYRKSRARYLLLRALGRRRLGPCTGPLALVHCANPAPPRLPTERWLRVRPHLCGICGSDLATVRAEGSTYFSPLTSTPFVLGHEIVGVIEESAVADWPVGTRVVIEPALGCEVRGVSPQCGRCAEGNYGNCENVASGDLAPGIQTGYCRDTGGGWSESLIAHASQLHRVPDELSDEEAVLAEPLACALHAALSVQPPSHPATQQTILVMGCGTMGLLTIAALRWIGYTGHVLAVAKHQHQITAALKLGASDIVQHDGSLYPTLAARLHASLHQPEIGRPTVIGGAELTFDCVGSAASLDAALRFTRARGEVVLVGMPGIPRGVDWTTIWYQELRVRGSYTYGWENWQGRRRKTFDLALDLLRDHGTQLKSLVTHKFQLTGYRAALRTALATGPTKSVKTVFEIG